MNWIDTPKGPVNLDMVSTFKQRAGEEIIDIYFNNQSPVELIFQTKDECDTFYNSLVASVGPTPVVLPVITSVVPDNGSPVDHTVGDTIQIHGARFDPSAIFLFTDGAYIDLFAALVPIDSTHYSVTMPPSVVGTFHVVYIDSNGLSCMLLNAIQTS